MLLFVVFAFSVITPVSSDSVRVLQSRAGGRYKILEGPVIKDLVWHDHFGKPPLYSILENLGEPVAPPSSAGPD